MGFSTLILAAFFGVMILIISRWLKIPAIVMLLAGGVILGPECIGLINTDTLGSQLRNIISICVAVILFEGGLTLKTEGFKKAPKVIWRLLTVGVLVTWLTTSFLIYAIFDFSIELSLTAASLVIVTGPTVITPLLKRFRVKDKLFHILHWEGVLIDPIGVFIAVLCFEWLSIDGKGFDDHLATLMIRLLVGIIAGGIGGVVISNALRRNWIDEHLINIFVVVSAIGLFVLSDHIEHESGILTVIIAGFVVGWTRPPRLKHLTQFKSEMTELSIAVVFVLLAANLKLSSFTDVGWGYFLLIMGVMFLVRPLSIVLCTVGTDLGIRERMFLSWVAPRGVIAGSMASLFALKLSALGTAVESAQFLETFTFGVIVSTIVIQGLSVGVVSKLLSVEEKEKKGWLFVGAHSFSEKLAEFIHAKTGGKMVFIDTNAESVKALQDKGLQALEGNALFTESLPEEVRNSIGHVMALTDNRDLNQLICERWSELVANAKLFRWCSENQDTHDSRGQVVWSELNKPSRMAYDINNNSLSFRAVDSKDEIIDESVSLMSFYQDNLNLLNPSLAEGSELLVLHSEVRLLRGSVVKEHVFFINEIGDALLDAVMEKAATLYPDLPHKDMAEKLKNREKEFPTTIAPGVTVPHIHCDFIDSSLCFVVKSKAGDVAHLAFVLLSPTKDPEEHLLLLGEIAKVASIPDNVRRLIQAESADVFLAILNEIEDN